MTEYQFKLDFSAPKESNPDVPVRETEERPSVDEMLQKAKLLQQGILNLGFKPPRAQSDIATRYEWKPGHITQEKAHFFTQWRGRQFHHILEADKENPQIFAVYSFYLQREDQSFEDLLAIHRPSPNAIVVIHDHTIHSYCTPWSQCQELPWIP